MLESHYGSDAWGPLAQALKAFVGGDRQAILQVHSDEMAPEPMPVAFFFRSVEEMRAVEREALERCRGRVLDVGAGVGSMALALQEQGRRVTAVEVIPEAVEIMRKRGVRDIRSGRVETLGAESMFDTVLVLMNGTALAGTLAGMPPLLTTLKGLLAEGGQILMDSTDLRGDGHEPGSSETIPGEGDYPGEVQYQMEFGGRRGAPFPQLFLDSGTFRGIAEGLGFRFEVVCTEGSGEYLARLILAEADRD